MRRQPIETQRLLIRPMVEADAGNVVAWRNAMRDLLLQPKQLTLESHLAWFSQEHPNRMDWVICLKEDGAAIGTVSFTNISSDGKRAESGKVLGREDLRGKGLAKEAYAAWLSFGFEELGFEEIHVRTRRTNTTNIALNRKLGFVEDADGSDSEWLAMKLSRLDSYC